MRVVTAGAAGFCVADGFSCGRHSTESLLEELHVGTEPSAKATARCVNAVPGNCDRRRRENLCLMSLLHSVLAACCVSTSFGVAG